MPIKNRQQVLVIAAIAVLGLFAGDKLVFDPLLGLWNARAERLTKLRQQVGDGQRLLRREESVRTQWAQMQRNTLTNNTSAAEQKVFQAIDRWANDSRVTISAITPQWKHDADDYMTLQCRLDAAGELGTLTRFLYAVEKDPMALKLESVELNAHDKAGQQLTLALQFSALVLTPQTTSTR
ncbi:MAG TPA: hypothetical protein VN578_18335 [Candidatus Binatia bacterium]|jgi:hypothetical protein|nr:hypothetical protein [Candidatus Binatia bacterium]